MKYDDQYRVSLLFPGTAYAFDTFTNEIIYRGFLCDPKPNVCGNNPLFPFNDIIVIDDGEFKNSLVLFVKIKIISLKI